MPTRSIKLKLIVPRNPGQLDAARSLWTTHATINEAVHHYESLLLQMRGRGYVKGDDSRVTDGEAQDLQLQLGRAAQERNGATSAMGSDDDVRALLAQCYESIVPAIKGEKGTAQAANAFLSPLVDPDSRGFTDIFDKVEAAPPWVKDYNSNDPEPTDSAMAWLDSDEGKKRRAATGAPPKWAKLARQGDEGWIQAFIDDLNKKTKLIAGVPSLMQRMRQLRLLPLFGTFVAKKIKGAAVVSTWDRLAFRLAVGHLLSWESWCRLASSEHIKRRARVAETILKHMPEGSTAARLVAELRAYERERQQILSAMPLGIDREFRISTRMIRGWPELRAKWLREQNPSTAALLALIAAEQTRLRGRFGDPDLFRWLARREHWEIWQTEEADVVSILARLNAMQNLVDRTRETAAMTLPEARLHPRCSQWEAEGGSNLKNYKLLKDAGGLLKAELPVLRIGEHGGLEEADITLPLAPSGQFAKVEIASASAVRKVTFQTASGEEYTGSVGSADLLLDWHHTRHRTLHQLEVGAIGPAYLKMAVDIEHKLPTGWERKRHPAITHFQTALGQKSKNADAVAAGLRILSVDLGVRTLASCAVFELVEAAPPKGFSIPLPDCGLWAVHERSFMLELPGEQVGTLGEAWRKQSMEELVNLRRTLARHRRFYRLKTLSGSDRQTALDDMAEAMQDINPLPVETTLLEKLRSAMMLPQPLWDTTVDECTLTFRAEFGRLVAAWRHRTRPREIRKFIGKSMWGIGYLTDLRRFLLGWSLAGRSSGEIRRLNREKMGTFSSRLLDHIDGIKDDRLKTGSDLIVQAARGFIRDEKGNWAQKFSPCHAVLFEDLSRYRMRTDRPRRENSQLMKWAHRAVPDEVKMQGELYGIHVVDTGGAFTSRYHARTETPGIRCHRLTKGDLANPAFMDLIARESPQVSPASFKIGDFVPLQGGEAFVCLNDHGFTEIQADINAALNLQRRFWTRHASAYRIPTRMAATDAGDVWIPASMGKRLAGGLGGFGMLVSTGDDTQSARWVTAKKGRRGLPKIEGPEVIEAEPDDAELTGLAEEMMEASGKVKVFFRDPSGVVLPDGLWYPADVFWSIVRRRTIAAISGKKKR